MSEPSSQLPILYDATTPVWRPLVDRTLRFAMVLGIEWSSLSLIEDSPQYVKIATLVIAILVLAVLESRYFLRLKGRLYFPSFIAGLLVFYGGVIAYAFIVYPPPHRSDPEGHPSMLDETKQRLAPSQTTPKSTFLGLDDAKRWELTKALRDASPTIMDQVICHITP
jgi:hypothetical protein